jgi:transglutaminase-like putative cysteine protease
VNVRTVEEQRKLLWDMVRRATGDARLRATLARVMRDENVPPRSPTKLATAIQRFAQTRIKYLREAPETLVHPARTLEWGVGDCDDLTILICSLLRSAKIPTRAVFVGWQARELPGRPRLRHVYPEARLRDRWVALEAVRAVPPGWNAADWRRSRGESVRVTTIGDPPNVEPNGTESDPFEVRG